MVACYKYLGVVLDQNNTFKQAAEDRLYLATKALWSMQRALSCAPGDAFKKLFDSLVVPVPDYGSPVWSNSMLHSFLEQLQHQAYRCFLGVGRKHAIAAAAHYNFH